MNFIHIGAGAGDLDPTSNFRDGFTEYVKKYNNNEDQIFLIEANPKNIQKLEETWKNYKNAKIFNFAVVPDKFKQNEIKLFYSEEDGPHYQLLSSDISHVRRYFPKSDIKHIYVKTIKVNSFLEKYLKDLKVESFSIDIEGNDYDVLMDIDFDKYSIENISIEYLHLKKIQKKNLIKKLISFGYSYNGFGLDHNKIDWLFTKRKSKWNDFVSMLFPYVHRIHYKRLNKILKKL